MRDIIYRTGAATVRSRLLRSRPNAFRSIGLVSLPRCPPHESVTANRESRNEVNPSVRCVVSISHSRLRGRTPTITFCGHNAGILRIQRPPLPDVFPSHGHYSQSLRFFSLRDHGYSDPWSLMWPSPCCYQCDGGLLRPGPGVLPGFRSGRRPPQVL